MLLALLWLNLALMLGEGINSLMGLAGLKLPGFVGCLMAGIALMACPYFIPNVIVMVSICLLLAVVPFVMPEA